MLKYRAKYAGILAAASAPVYFLIQLVFGSDIGASLVRALWFLLVVFLVSMVIKWEEKKAVVSPEERGFGDERPPRDEP